jgi:hypothetical protein
LIFFGPQLGRLRLILRIASRISSGIACGRLCGARLPSSSPVGPPCITPPLTLVPRLLRNSVLSAELRHVGFRLARRHHTFHTLVHRAALFPWHA